MPTYSEIIFVRPHSLRKEKNGVRIVSCFICKFAR
ncbi:MAG: hypothetical protein Hyperionvirus13_13 [Hyperionvirus sp.]|uniref:Uncharacterized protein n=1 Tax=Hyperionvirus sp. TaxID=2487770 RepID=A0A3G5AC74_9VIRU|nr:MAG: hypothetical protein Hyperionvirus13_13 [Hyperionvirus sp.]